MRAVNHFGVTALLLIVSISGDAKAQIKAPPQQKPGFVAADSLVVDSFDSVSQWRANPAAGVEIAVHPDNGRHGRGLRVDFDFHGHPGYGIVHRDVDLELPANYRFSFALRGAAPANTLEFKLVDPTHDNVWWSNNPNFIFPPAWRTIARKKHEICYAWGPANGGEIRHVAAIEFAITAGSGGKGTVWIDDLALTPLEVESPFDVTTPIASIPIVGTWESVAAPNGGVPTTMDFAADGAFTLSAAPTVDFSYTVADNHLTTTLEDPGGGNGEKRTTPIRLAHDTLFQKDGNGPGNDLTMTRVRPAKASDDPIIGVWSYLLGNGSSVFVAFARNGKGMFRLPMSSCSGTWTQSGSRQLMVSNCMIRLVPDKFTCSIAQPPTKWEYSIETGVLTIKNDRGNEARYTRRASLD